MKMNYRQVEIDDNSPNKTKYNKKTIVYEYIFYTIISFFLAIYCTFNLGIITHNLAKKYDFKLDGLVKSYSFLGGYRDLSDFQWRYYRGNLGLIIVFASLFVLICKVIKKYFDKEVLKIFYLLFGLGYAFFLHRIRIIYLILVLLFSYFLCCSYSILGKKFFIALTWIFCITIKVTSEIYNGYKIYFFDLPDFLKNPLIGWQSVFGLSMLKIISFNMEFANIAEKDFSNNKLISLEQVRNHCQECKEDKFCLTALKFVFVKESDFSLINLLIYIFYPPFYFSGPTIMFHSFIFQINNFKISKHNDFFYKKNCYLLRCIIIFLILEVFNHYIYVNAIMTNKRNNWIFEEFRENNSYFNYFFLAFNNLVFIFLKFALIWKIARFWDGLMEFMQKKT